MLQTRTRLARGRFNERAQQAREQSAGLNELGMAAIYEFEAEDMPVTVAVDPTGHSIHETGPTEWRAKIAKIPVLAH
jgi:tartrate dehydratase beta subunit/fumarate hydratase class I family protein